MTRSNASPLPSVLRRVLDRYRRRWKAVNFERGLFLTLGLVVAAVGLAVAADRLFRLAPTVRQVALVVIAALFLASMVRWVIWPVVRRITDRDAAVRVGRHFPQMEEDLVSAVELSNDVSNGRDEMSHSLVVSVLNRIANRTVGKVDPKIAVSLRPMLLTAAAFVLVAGTLLTAYLVRPESVLNALNRLLMPTQSIPYFSYTKLQVSPGDQVIRVGDAAEVQVSLSGRPVDAAVLEGRSGNSPVRATLPCSDAHGEWKSGRLFEDLVYRVKAGDALSDWYRVRVVPPPSLRSKSAVLQDPPYAGEDLHRADNIQGTLEVIEGMGVVLLGDPAPRGEEAEFASEGVLTSGDQSFPMKPDDKGLLQSPSFKPAKSGDYLLTLKDGFGLQSLTPDSTFIKVKPDVVPQVSITDPARDLLILSGERVEAAVEAVDEFGMRELVFCQRKIASRDKAGDKDAAEAGPWVRKTLKAGGIRIRNLDAKAELDIVGMGMAPGEAIEYMAEASDYAGDSNRRRGASQVWRITMLSLADHMELLTGKLREAQADLLRRAAEQRAEAVKVDEMAQKAKTEDISAAAQEAKDREKALERSTEETARKIEALIPEAMRNSTVPPETLTELERLSRETAAVASGQMAKASASLSKAGQSEAGQQSPSAQEAQKSESEAAEKLESLAGAAERLQKTNALAKLAHDAERLAARQNELKENAATLAPETAGQKRENLKKELGSAVDRLAQAEESVKAGIETLNKDIQQAAGALAFTAPDEADAAAAAGEKLETDKTADKAAALAKQMQENALFSSLPQHEAVAKSLTEVAEMLKKASGQQDPLEQMAKEIEEFRKRQTEINAQAEAAINKSSKEPPADQGNKQSRLARDVAEQAAALKDLASEIAGFESQTADRMSKAADEMKAGAANLFASEFPPGLEHGKKALALLQDAGEQLAQEGGQMGGAQQGRQDMAAMLLLQKIIKGQKQVNRDTASTAEQRITDEQAFNRVVNGLADQQSAVRTDARELEQMLAQAPKAKDQVTAAGQKMDLSRLALAAGDTSDKTRQVQRQILIFLEQLMAQQKSAMSSGQASGQSMSLAQMRMMAMMQMMGQMGNNPGGFHGGSNAPILPATVTQASGEEWRKTRSRFEGNMSEGAQEACPVQFRDLVNAYFDRLRKEPPR